MIEFCPVVSRPSSGVPTATLPVTQTTQLRSRDPNAGNASTGEESGGRPSRQHPRFAAARMTAPLISSTALQSDTNATALVAAISS